MSKKIIIIEDDLGILDAMSILLSEESYFVISISNGRKALSEIAKSKPKLIFLDMLISGIDGCDICREVKSSPDLKDIKVVMISAHPDAKERVKGCKADYFIPKPFNSDELLKVAKKFTSN